MIYEAKVLGAKAVLLICSILSKGQIEEYLGICDELGISAIVETHDEKEIETALSANGRIIGVNNRNLKDFTVDSSNSSGLRKLIPEDKIFVSESGLKTPDDIADIRKAGADAVLIGETLMRAANKKEALKLLKSKLN
jgi:indole-3-glycerol phosphate synthase